MLDSLYFLRLTGLCFVSYTKQGIRYDPNENSVKDGLNRLEFDMIYHYKIRDKRRKDANSYV